jgi:hypothetical protein
MPQRGELAERQLRVVLIHGHQHPGRLRVQRVRSLEEFHATDIRQAQISRDQRHVAALGGQAL